MSNEKKLDKHRAIFFIVILVCGAIGITIYSIFTGNTNQVFTDVVNEFTALNGSNKSAERSMFYIFSIIGAIIISLYYALRVKRIDDLFVLENTSHRYVLAALLVFIVTEIILNKTVNMFAVTALIVAVIALGRDKKIVVPAMVNFFIMLYSLVALYRLYVLWGGDHNLDEKYLIIAPVLSTLAFILIGKTSFFIKGIVYLQVFIPMLLLVYLANSYNWAGENIQLAVSKRIIIPIYILIILFIVEAIYKIIKLKSEKVSLHNSLGYGTCVCIMAFNQYYGTGSMIALDLHHSFEDVIGYSQIFELGRAPYSQYIPVSGLYSVVHGFIFEMFGHGLVSFYNIASNFYYFIIVLLIVFLLRKHFDSEWVFFISLTFCIGTYNRIIWMAPIFLLLTLPKLIENKNLWLKVWIFTSFLHGLYYPICGAAMCLGFMPLGIWQVYKYIKSGMLKNDIKTLKFWFGWLITLMPIAIGMPILLGTARHMLAMASQTIFADGTTRFGQVVAEDFLPYVKAIGVRLFFYYQASYLVVISIVWISIVLFWVNGGVYFREKKLIISNPIAGFTSLLVSIVMLTSFSYTTVRFEVGDIYSRNMGAVRLSFLILIFLVAKYMYKKNSNAIFVFCFACFLLALMQQQGFYTINEDNAKLQASYNVPDDYIRTDMNDVVDRFGDSFIPKNIYDAIEESYAASLAFDKEKSYLGIVGYFGEYYFNRYKGDSVLELYLTVRGFDATQETVDLIRKNNTIIGYSFNQVNNYYMYHYLATSGEYVWNPNNRCFSPNKDKFSNDEIKEFNKEYLPALEDANLGKTAGSWGSSMDSLESIFTELDIDMTISDESDFKVVSFKDKIIGDEADFIYIDFDDMDENYIYTLITQDSEFAYNVPENSFVKYLMKKSYNPGMQVYIEWDDDAGESHTMSCQMDEGKLLIPLGAAKGWLFDGHSELRIRVSQDEEFISIPKINNIRMLKLREIK